ncbi:hypothetical protein B0H14DRAFT_2557296 [Mycena olivaceomarginata]|nr:hypothetical protein B0H14DRAFT_2557296 [Mycena olivaceomarginata]
MALAWWGQDLWNHGAADGLGGGERALAVAADWHMLLKELDWFLLYAANDRDGEEKEAAEREVTAKPKPKKKGPTKRKAVGAEGGPAQKRARAKEAPAPREGPVVATAAEPIPSALPGDANAVNDENSVVQVGAVNDENAVAQASAVTIPKISTVVGAAERAPEDSCSQGDVDTGSAFTPTESALLSTGDIDMPLAAPAVTPAALPTPPTAESLVPPVSVDPGDPLMAPVPAEPVDPPVSPIIPHHDRVGVGHGRTNDATDLEDPFADDPYAGMTTEEIQEILDDPEANEDDKPEQ